MEQRQQRAIESLYQTIAALRSAEECSRFFEDLCTEKEILGMAQRFATARLLHRGVGYQAICEQVGTSSATISRVSRCLQFGSGGYQLALAREKEAADDAQSA